VRHPRPFTLPTEPIDQYEVFWWRVETYGDIPAIVESRAVYHASASWFDVTGDPDQREGAPFIKQWQIFRNGRFSGRGHDHSCPAGDGWNYWENFDWSRSYATRPEANIAAQMLACDLLSTLDERAEALRLWLAKLR